MYTMEFGNITKENLMKAFDEEAIESDPDENRDDILYLKAGLDIPNIGLKHPMPSYEAFIGRYGRAVLLGNSNIVMASA